MSSHEDTADLMLAGLLAAASAPAAGPELTGEDAAVAAFRAAPPSSPARPRRIDMLKTALAKMLTVKVIATCVALGGAGGVALAAGTGTLPGGPPHRPAPHPPAAASPAARPHPSGSPSPRAGLSARPADLWRLCERWSARPGEERRHALDEPEFGNLVRQAGADRARVDHFCADLRKARPGDKPRAPRGAGQNPGAPDPSRAGR